jgi:tmRNA-binding protein
MLKTKPNHPDQTIDRQVDFIINNLSKEDKDVFLNQILTAVLSGVKCIDIVSSWHETAEINSDPARKRKLLLRKNKLLRLLQKDNV